MIIDLPRFVSAERPSWSELEAVLRELEEDPARKMSLPEATRLHFLYQKVSSDLVRVRTFASEPELQEFLESLVARAYGEIHGASSRIKRWNPLRWFFIQFPVVFRRRSRAFAMSCLITIAGMLFGGFAVALDDEAKGALIPKQFSHLLGDPAKRVAAEEKVGGKDKMAGMRSSFAGMLMANNIRVSITCMALGMTWGLGTILVLFQNGLTLGLIMVDYIRAGQTVFLLGWLMPHGVIEIPCVLIAGQAGLVLAHAMIGRGSPLPMSARLRAVSGDLATLVGALAVMLVWAGIIESFLSQYHQPVIPYALKIGFGVTELIALVWLLNSRLGKSDSEPAAALP